MYLSAGNGMSCSFTTKSDLQRLATPLRKNEILNGYYCNNNLYQRVALCIYESLKAVTGGYHCFAKVLFQSR